MVALPGPAPACPFRTTPPNLSRMSLPLPSESSRVAVIGGGPAGLMAAETLAGARRGGRTSRSATPSVGRKFLLAGKGGLNLTHSEAPEPFLAPLRHRGDRPGAAPRRLRRRRHCGTGRTAWASTTFVGSSGRVFPTDMKAAPLLRAWLQRLRAAGVLLLDAPPLDGLGARTGPHAGLQTPAGPEVLATPTPSCWPSAAAAGRALGSDGAWVPRLARPGCRTSRR